MLPFEIRAISFGVFARRGSFTGTAPFESVKELLSRTGANTVTLVPSGLQATPQSTGISIEKTVSDEELTAMIDYIHGLGAKVFLKPTANCANGSWRAYISFFDEDVVCEPKWSEWFHAYSEFQCHYAEIAERTHCEMFIAGCEMVMTEHRSDEWREVIRSIRRVYSGPVSYNTDKYQEHNVKWWDEVDYISSSGYYPFGSWETQLDRIEKVVEHFQKPFFFAETGCMSVTGSGSIPNNWSVTGDAAPEEQAEWYREMFSAVSRRPWLKGVCLWDWASRLYPLSEAGQRKDYNIYGKPAEAVVKEYFSK